MTELYLDGRLFNGTEEEFQNIKVFSKKEWYQNGRLHRNNGPALIYQFGVSHWYQNGSYIKSEIIKKRSPISSSKINKSRILMYYIKHFSAFVILPLVILFALATRPHNNHRHRIREVATIETTTERSTIYDNTNHMVHQKYYQQSQPQAPTQPRTTITNHNVENQNIIITIDSEALRELGISEDEIRNLLTR